MNDHDTFNSPQASLPILQAILDTTVDGLITISRHGQILSFNKACERIFGYRADEVIGENVRILMPEPDRGQHDQYLDNYDKTQHAKIIGIGREVMGLRRNGETFPLDLSVAKVEINDNVLYSGIVRDISLRKQAEEQITESSAALERYAYITSHDLKEPLRTITAFVEILNLDHADELSDEARECLEHVTSAAGRMKDLINDVLDYSRLSHDDAGNDDFEAKVEIEHALGGLHDSIREVSAEITIGDMPRIRANPMRFSRLIQNLVSNAIKYRDKARTPQIEISAHRHEAHWQFDVSDNGIGIKPDYAEQIFVMFTRLHGKHEYPGTGIGLAICKRIVSGWGGEIWVESEPGAGSRFCFTVPA